MAQRAFVPLFSVADLFLFFLSFLPSPQPTAKLAAVSDFLCTAFVFAVAIGGVVWWTICVRFPHFLLLSLLLTVLSR
jgi:hypothetical protein